MTFEWIRRFSASFRHAQCHFLVFNNIQEIPFPEPNCCDGDCSRSWDVVMCPPVCSGLGRHCLWSGLLLHRHHRYPDVVSEENLVSHALAGSRLDRRPPGGSSCALKLLPRIWKGRTVGDSHSSLPPTLRPIARSPLVPKHHPGLHTAQTHHTEDPSKSFGLSSLSLFT